MILTIQGSEDEDGFVGFWKMFVGFSIGFRWEERLGRGEGREARLWKKEMAKERRRWALDRWISI